jgi:hypothetical protein
MSRFADQFDVSMDTATATYKESALAFMTPPNPTQLSTLKARGKLIVVHGTADPVFSPNDTMPWYDALKAADASAPDYARLFLVPGMNHCSGGPATDRFDMLTALENWVEKGTAPDALRATVNAADPDVIAAGRCAPTRSKPCSRTAPPTSRTLPALSAARGLAGTARRPISLPTQLGLSKAPSLAWASSVPASS